MAIIPEGDEKFYDEKGNLPSYIQDDLDRVTSEGNIPADPDNYTISGGSGNWTITWADGTTANTTVRNPLSAANDARLLANAFEARKTGSGTGSRELPGSNIQSIPDWVDPDYGYDVNNPRKPNMREMMEALSGKTVEELYSSGEDYSQITKKASELLYGVVGSNTDTRNWNAIFEAAKVSTGGPSEDTFDFKYDPNRLEAAANIATSKMYGGTSVSYMASDDPNEPSFAYVTAANGTILRSLDLNNSDSTMGTLKSFGVRDSSWIDPVKEAMSGDIYLNSDLRDSYFNTFNTIANSYSPWEDYNDFWDMEFVSGISTPQPKVSTTQTIDSTDTGTTATTTQTIDDTETGQTITSPDVETVDEAVGDVGTDTTKPTYEDVPQAVTMDTTSTGTTGTTGVTQPSTTGTVSTPLQTSGISAVPNQITVKPNYTGTTMSNLTSQSQGGFGGIKTYQNQFGQKIQATVDASGNPITYVPPGYTAVARGGLMNGYEKGGLESDPNKSSEDIYLKIAQRVMDFQGNSSDLKKQMAANPALAAKLGSLTDALRNMSSVRMGAQTGTDVDNLASTIGPEEFKEMQKNVVTETMTGPRQAAVTQVTPDEADMIGTSAGQAPDQASMAEAATVGTVTQAQMPTQTGASTVTASTVTPEVQAETDKLQAQQGTVSEEAQVTAQQQETSSVTGMEAAQGQAIMMENPVQREIEEGELISGAANAEKAAKFTEQIEAATATPSKQATVAGQLEGLMQQFEGGETPPWAAGSMRTAMATLAARGLSASSMAGQAVIQAAMESALPIAQADAATQATFEAQNLSNRQQRAMLAAQQRATFLGQEFDQEFQARVQNSARIGDIANMNFTAEQNIALENSRAANTMELNNLSNKQAMVMAEAAALANLDMANLNNRQQAAVQNAQSFLQMDMTNLNNAQQTEMFKSQQNLQALFTDQAAENAAAQFNATSENQTNQFFASLAAQTSQFNASQANAMDQFNVNNVNALRQFNAEMQNQRTMFNAQNGLVVAQANAQWRQNIATMNTAAQNESNMQFAQTMNELTATNLDEIWQRERDLLSMAFQVSENNANRANEVVLQKIAAQAQKDAAELQADLEAEANTGDFIKEILVGISGWI